MRRAQMIAGTAAFACGSWAWAAAAPGRFADGVVLIDQDAHPFTLRALRGKPVLLTFVATRCADACPLANAAFRALEGELVRRRLAVTLLTVTLDPRYDTPFVMARTARAVVAVAPRWRFASGTAGDVQRLLDAFGVVVQADAAGIPDVHTAAAFVLASDGRLRRAMLLSTDFVRQALAVLRTTP